MLTSQPHLSDTRERSQDLGSNDVERSDSAVTRAALIEYHVGPAGTTIFLVLPGIASPRVFKAFDPTSGLPVTASHLHDITRRLLVDFHGLPEHWDRRPDADAYARVLHDLPPAVSAAKRTQPIRELTIARPAYSYDLTYWERLSDALLPQALKDAVYDCNLLCIVPHGPLHALPFAALRWSPSEYLIERFGLASAPSATVLRFCQYKNRRRTIGPSHRPETCFVASVAATEDTDVALFDADREALEALFGHQGGRGRITALSGTGSRPGVPPASKEAIASQATGHDVVHLACHGVFGPDLGSEDPLESALLVSDGHVLPTLGALSWLPPQDRGKFLLTAREVFSLDLQADLVTLRACSSGRGEVHSGDEVLGLSRAFLYAGSPSLIVTLWNVNQRTSRMLLAAFYRLWLDEMAPLPKWRALREAQLCLLRGSAPHPYHWAPFVLVGDWM